MLPKFVFLEGVSRKIRGSYNQIPNLLPQSKYFHRHTPVVDFQVQGELNLHVYHIALCQDRVLAILKAKRIQYFLAL